VERNCAPRAEGYTLIGFTPGHDREEVAPGAIKCVIEAAGADVNQSAEQMKSTASQLQQEIGFFKCIR
jgi:hypothetical protein